MKLENYIRSVPDFPRPGILFRDITPLLNDAHAFSTTIDMLSDQYDDSQIDVICGVEARGFLFACPLAYKLKKPFVPIRKRGKLPLETNRVEFILEYGSDAVEIHVDALKSGSKVLIVDDLLATGGTLSASCKLIQQTGCEIAGLAVVVELSDLNGRNVLSGYEVRTLVRY